MENDGEVEDMREKTPAFSECVEKSVEASQMEVGIGGEEDNGGGNSRVDDNKRNRGLLERMMEENEKMMSWCGCSLLFKYQKIIRRNAGSINNKMALVDEEFQSGSEARRRNQEDWQL